jgi:hypothetical protein
LRHPVDTSPQPSAGESKYGIHHQHQTSQMAIWSLRHSCDTTPTPATLTKSRA